MSLIILSQLVIISLSNKRIAKIAMVVLVATNVVATI